MSLAPGQRIGPYEVIASIGAGGMGEVYRARDSRLDRDVALKVLPDLLAADRERLARFEREARTLASLNHPNVAAIYGIEPLAAAGAESTGRALVMELVEGEDLSARLARGPMAVADVVAVARQIADALEAAHERGIIHRDLKPSNVKVRTDDTVKLLDFGLAKALSADPESSAPGEVANSPTMTSPAMTQQGFILGTAAYMSPEQAKGKPVDRRADIWAFGVLLYEMLAGRKLFEAETVSETLAAVLRQDVDHTAIPAGTPAALQRLVARCLDRDPRTRLRDIGEARVILSSPLSDSGAPALPGPVPVVAPARSRSALVWIAAGLVAGAALATIVLWGTISGSSAASAGAGASYVLQRLTELPGAERQPDISPDGRQVLYTSAAAGNPDIYLLRVGGSRAINLTAGSAADDEQARFSPTGEQIVFRSSRDGGGLFLMGATGESAKRLTTAGFDPAWSPDGTRIAYSTEGVFDPYARAIFAELWTVEVASGKATRLYIGDAVQPAWSPDGARIAFWANTGGQRDLWTIPVSGGAPQAVTEDAATDWSPAWSPDGRWLYFSSDRGGSMNLWRVPIDSATGRADGAPEAITNSVTPLGYLRLSADGSRLVAMAYDSAPDITIASFDPAAPDRIVERLTIRGQPFDACRPSPDGLWLACTKRGALEDLVLLRSDGGETRRLTDDVFKDRGATWSPDGKTLAFYSTRSGQWETWSIRVDGSDLRQVTAMGKDTGWMVWSPDGRSGIISAISTRSVWRIDPARSNTIENAEFLKGPSDAGMLDMQVWSPDGTMLAGLFFVDQLTAIPAVWDFKKQTLRKLDLPPMVSDAGRLAFLPDSRRLLAASPKGLVLVDLAGGAPRLIREGSGSDTYFLSQDGRTLVIEHRVFDADIWLLESGAGK